MQPIKTALLSYGMSGKVFHAPFLHLHDGFELVGSWERSKKLIQQDYSYVQSFSSIEDILKDSSIELVIVNTPTYTHYEYCKQVLEAGKHAVVEKAFVATTDEAVELHELAKSKGLKLCVFQNRRWDSDFKTVKRVLDSGVLGEIVEARIAFDRWRPELSPKAHKEKPSPGAGIIKDLGAHVIDQALTLFGMPVSVLADVGITREHSEVDDYFDILLKYEKTRVHVHGGYFFKEELPGFVLNGTRGTMHKSRADVQEDQLKAGIKPDNERYGVEPDDAKGLLHTEEERKYIPTERGDYMDFHQGVYDAIRNGCDAPVSSEDGINVMRVIDAAFESAEQGKVIKL
ncbi:Gfo/Idh/MocA family oxidoreductase [Marinoscillum sp.]|uniref:Gfo/Idh/MocA family oxidoreductase n=1 Tax=Marinoscillum sp. TaxID=2024838 RepID=UPI003BAAEBA6